MPEWLKGSSEPWCSAQGDYPDIEFIFGYNIHHAGYSVNTRVGGETTYVTASSPGGSSVSYSFPTSLLDAAFDHAFHGGPPLNLSGEFVAVELNSPDSQDLANKVLETLVNAGGGREAIAFVLDISDFEGRNELRAVLAKAMLIAAGQEHTPVIASVHAMMSNGTRAVASASASGGEISTHGWWILGSGVLDQSGGGFEYQASYSAWFEDVVRGSVYILPAP